MKLEQKGTSNRKVHLFVQWFATPALPPAPLLPLPIRRPLSSSGRRCDGAGRLPPSPGVCETPVRRASGWPPSSTRSSTADRWRWRRRTVQTSRRSEYPGTHRTAGHPARMASLPPAIRCGNNWKLAKLFPFCFCILLFLYKSEALPDVFQRTYKKWNRWLPER